MYKKIAIACLSVGIVTLMGRQLQAGLEPCQWLDRLLNYSGCFKTLQVDDRETFDQIGLSPQAPVGLSPQDDQYQTFVFAPNGRTIAYPQSATVLQHPKKDLREVDGLIIQVINVNNNQVVRSFSPDETDMLGTSRIVPIRVEGLAFSPNSSLLVASVRINNIQAVYLWNINNGKRLWRLTGSWCPKLMFSPDSQYILCPQRRLRVSDAKVLHLGESDRQLLASKLQIEEPKYPNLGEAMISPDGSVEAKVDLGPSLIKILTLRKRSTNEQIELAAVESDKHIDWLYFSPDSKRLAASTDHSGLDNKSISIWSTWGERLRYIHLTERPMGIRWASDSNIFAIGYSDNTIQLFKVDQ